MAPRWSPGGKDAVNSVVGRLWCLPLGAAATGPNEELTEVHPSVRRNGARKEIQRGKGRGRGRGSERASWREEGKKRGRGREREREREEEKEEKERWRDKSLSTC